MAPLLEEDATHKGTLWISGGFRRLPQMLGSVLLWAIRAAPDSGSNSGLILVH